MTAADRAAAFALPGPDWTARALVEHAIDDAEIHGRDGEPDHEVGDLQDLARRLARVMTADQVRDALADWTGYADPGSTTLPAIKPPPCVAAGAACYAHAAPGGAAAGECEPFPACPARVNGQPCGKPLRYCRIESPTCLHCECGWSGDPVAYRRAHPACLLQMGTLCAGHAAGARPSSPCDTTERPASSRRKPRR